MGKKKILLSGIIFIANMLSAQECIVPAGSEGSAPGSWFWFKKTVNLTAPKEDNMLKIAADTKFWLYVNDEQICFEGGLKQGPSPTAGYYDVFANIDAFKRGKNTISVLLWHFGKHGFSHKNTGLPFIYIDGNVGHEKITSDQTWKAMAAPTYYIPDGQKPNYRLAESNIGYDANEDVNIASKDYDFSTWKAVKTVSSPYKSMVQRPIPQWKNCGLKKYKQIDVKGDTLWAHLPYNAQITPYFKITTPAGGSVDMRTDNYNGGSAPNVFAEYKTREGRQSYESLGWMNGHAVRYIFPKGTKIHKIMYRETGFDSEFAGKFTCENEALNTLWDKAARTLYITMRDTYMDCPDRERAQWWGDVVNELGEAFYALSPQSHLLTKKGILELLWWQRRDSTIFSPVPAGNWEQELPMQMLASVGYYGVWTYFAGTGDTLTLKEVYPAIKKYIHIWKTDDEGLVVPRKGGWTWGDWGDNKDLYLLYNQWYTIALDGLAEMAAALNHPEDKAWAEQRSEQLKRVFHDKFWNGEAYRSPDYKGKTDDRAQALAVISATAPKSVYPAITSIFKHEKHASPYMEKYVLQALCMMGEHELAAARMQERYAPMIESNLSTLWEGWGIGNEGFGGGTYNHAWSGGPLTILSQYFAGISATAPLFSLFEIRPNYNVLSNIEAIVPTRDGEIYYAYAKSKVVSVKIRVPKGSRGDYIIPEGYLIKKVKSPGKSPQIEKGKIPLERGKWQIVLKEKKDT